MRMAEFCAKSLEVPDLAEIAEHMDRCPQCRALFHEVLEERTGPYPKSIVLSYAWLKDEHLEYEQLVAYVDNKLDEIDREMLDIHLGGCASCREDVRSFVEYRKLSETVKHITYAPVAESLRPSYQSWWITNNRTGIAAALAVVVLGISVSLLLFYKRKGTPQDSPSVSVVDRHSSDKPDYPGSQSKGGQDNGHSSPSPSLGGKHSGLKASNLEPSWDARNDLKIRDGQNVVTVHKNGNVSGLMLGSQDRGLIKEVLANNPIKKPEIINEISGDESALRGTQDSGGSFQLVYPIATVIADDHPTFSWEAVQNASSYEVVVADLTGREITRSPKLKANQTKWKTIDKLPRGQSYSWAVIADVNGKEIVAPAASAREARFNVLSNEKFEALARLHNQPKSHLVTGLFYANSGMISEAEQEFQALASDNPHSVLALRLLKTIRSWR